MTRRRYSVIIP